MAAKSHPLDIITSHFHDNYVYVFFFFVKCLHMRCDFEDCDPDLTFSIASI